MSFWEIIRESFGWELIGDSLLTSILMLYGFLFVSNLFCLIFILRKFFTLYNVQTGNNFVMSSSDMFSDNKGTLPMRVWLMLLIPFFYIYFILYYGNQLKNLYPETKVPMAAFVLLSVGVTALGLIVSFLSEYISAAYMQTVGFFPYDRNLSLLPLLLVAIANVVSDYLLLKILRENFELPEKKEDF